MGAGVHHPYVETHSWSRSLAFWQALGFEIEPGWGPSDGILRCAAGPYVFLREVSADQPLALHVYLAADDLHRVAGSPAVQVERGPYDAGWGPSLLDVEDPDGRSFVVRSTQSES